MKNDELHLGSWEDADRAMAMLAAARAVERQVRSEMEADLASVRAEYEARLQTAEMAVGKLEVALSKFARQRKKDFRADSDGGRSYEHAGVVMGFRQTPPAVRIENEPKALDFLTHFEGGAFVRVKVEPDRQALADVLKDDSSPAVEKLAAHGITLQQKDKFFVEVKAAK